MSRLHSMSAASRGPMCVATSSASTSDRSWSLLLAERATGAPTGGGRGHAADELCRSDSSGRPLDEDSPDAPALGGGAFARQQPGLRPSATPTNRIINSLSESQRNTTFQADRPKKGTYIHTYLQPPATQTIIAYGGSPRLLLPPPVARPHYSSLSLSLSLSLYLSSLAATASKEA
jgi:hypothetical protein